MWRSYHFILLFLQFCIYVSLTPFPSGTLTEMQFFHSKMHQLADNVFISMCQSAAKDMKAVVALVRRIHNLLLS